MALLPSGEVTPGLEDHLNEGYKIKMLFYFSLSLNPYLTYSFLNNNSVLHITNSHYEHNSQEYHFQVLVSLSLPLSLSISINTCLSLSLSSPVFG